MKVFLCSIVDGRVEDKGIYFVNVFFLNLVRIELCYNLVKLVVV